MSLLFKLYYNPTIIGNKNIPKHGPVILCGNHLNELDSKLIKNVVKRPVHWINNNYEEMVKYLNDNQIVGVFPESIINIYRLSQLKIMSLEKKIIEISNNEKIRSNDKLNHVYTLKNKIEKEIIQLELSKQKLLEKGINVIDYDILLPFDDSLVRAANKTNSLVIPFAINGSYIRNKKNLKVRFGKPIYVNDNLEQSNRIIRESVKQLEYKNL